MVKYWFVLYINGKLNGYIRSLEIWDKVDFRVSIKNILYWIIYVYVYCIILIFYVYLNVSFIVYVYK